MKPHSNPTFQQLKRDLFSQDWNIAQAASNQLAEIDNEAIFIFLINLLNSTDHQIRSLAALALRKKKDNRAIRPLIQSILRHQNKYFNGTMVYALQTLDCKDHLVDLFNILFTQAYEAQMMAYAILDTQVFEFSRQDLKEIQKMWSCFKINLAEHPTATLEMIEDTYEGFMSYYKEE